MARCFGEETDYWADYGKALDMALDVRRWLETPVRKPSAPGKTPRVDAADVKARADIVALVSRYTELKKSGRRFAGLCPLHADKKSPSLVVYPDQQSWHCFGCQRGGDVFAFLMAVENTDFKGAVEYVSRI